MTKALLFTIFFLWSCTRCHCQADTAASPDEIVIMKKELSITTQDTSRILLMANLSYVYAYLNADSSLLYGQRALKQSEEINFPKGRANALAGLGNMYLRQTNYAQGLDYQLKALQVAGEYSLEREKAICFMELAYTYSGLSDTSKAMTYFKRSRDIYSKIPFDIYKKVENEIGLSELYMQTGRNDSALACLQQLYNDPRNTGMLHVILQVMGNLYINMQDYPAALKYLSEAISRDLKGNDFYSQVWAYQGIAIVYKNTHQTDSCIFYAKKSLSIAQELNAQSAIASNSLLLSEQYEHTDVNEALYYRKMYDSAVEKIYGPGKILELQKTLAEEQERQRQLETDRVNNENRRKQYLFWSGLAILVLIVGLLYRNNLQQRRGKKIVEEKSKVIEKTLSDLRATQSQLIQSEKMASLGELTAGIAHEIQNPLNFVNNFSEVNNELIEEVKTQKSNLKSEELDSLLNDIFQNNEKINHHGKRADSIVKGMLQHSRTSTGQKEPTDINDLCDEYVRLAYHGLRAKDKSFNAKFETDFGATVGKLNVVPQDIGRVILNLVNNAFYAASLPDRRGFKDPVVWISTKKEGNNVLIKVRDNGPGIPANILDKIFQPFFTTKPTGQGTGLGLSLSYDIIKAHGGELKVETKEGEGSTFTIVLSNVFTE